MAKKYDKYWDLPKKKCEIKTFQADMSLPLITFTTCSVSMATLVEFIILVSFVPFSQFIACCHGNQKEWVWPKTAKNVKRYFLHIHISNNTPILNLIFICWNVIAQSDKIKIINKPNEVGAVKPV